MTENKGEVGSYLKRIGQIPLLKPDEEIELGKQVKRMMTCWEKNENLQVEKSYITEEEWAKEIGISVRELQLILKRGKRAKEKMIQANLRLVVAVSKKYQGKGLEFMDLVSEGNLGLIRAVEKFEYDKGYKFSTYAYHWIRQALVRAICDKGRTIRVPVHINEEISKLKKVQLEIRQKYGRSATVRELSERLEISPEKIRVLRSVNNPMLSLDQKVLGDEDNSTLLSFLADPNGDLGKFLDNLGNKELVEQCLCGLKPQEQRVLREYYLETPSLTLNEIGKKMNLSRERVRHIKNNALDKLKQVIVTEKNDESEIMSVNFESITPEKSLKFKSRLKGSLKVETQEKVKSHQLMVTETLRVKEAEKTSIISDQVEHDSLNLASKIIRKSPQKSSKTKSNVKDNSESSQSKVKKKSSAKSKPKTTLSKAQQRELKKQLNQLSYQK